jgi:NAD(P)-dependent dehydrogenase (short-subunit alcohol dehydrogenase family)
MGKNIIMNMKKEKHMKTAVIVGATGNLGSAIVKVLEEAGYQIDPVWNSPDHPDATKASSYKNLPDTIDLAVYAPGLNIVKNTESLTEEEWDNVMNVNLKGAFLFAQAAFPAMKKSGNATFVAISSIMVTHPYPYRVAYTASKAALEGLTRTLAVEWGQYGIRAQSIRLGHLSGLMKTTKTNPQLLEAVKKNTPEGYLIPASDVASYVLWLAEGGSKAVNGGVIDFDPAYTINRWPL